jgi:hypothetical protein
MRGSRLALVCAAALLPFASSASAQDPYYDFRIPEARSFSCNLVANARWFADDSHAFANNTRTTSRLGALRSVVDRRAESEAQSWDLSSELWNAWTTNERKLGGSSFGSQFQTLDRTNISDYRWSNFASLTHYWGGTDWGYDGSAALSYSYDRFVSNNDQSFVAGASEVRQSVEDGQRIYQGFASAAFGVGYGRVRDVTGVYEAQVLERRLTAMEHLKQPLSNDTRQRLAQLFAMQSLFGEAHDRSDRYFWRQVERILDLDSAVVDSTLDAWTLLRVLEPSTLGVPLARRAGWRVTGSYVAASNWGHLDLHNRLESVTLDNGVPTSSSRSDFDERHSLDQNHGFVRFDGTYHRPVGMRWQAGGSAAIAYGDGPDRRIMLQSSVEADHLIADRWIASAALSHQLDSIRSGGVRVSPEWVVTAQLQLAYFIEDAWAAFVGERLLQARPAVPFGTSSFDAFSRQHELQIGLTWRPVGRFEAPGLGISEQLTRMPL